MSANGVEIVEKELSYLIVKAFFEFRHSGRSVILGMLLYFGPKAKYHRHFPGRRMRSDSRQFEPFA